MEQASKYTIPTLETTPANIALWAQASFFFYMAASAAMNLQDLTLVSEIDYPFGIAAAISGLALLFRVQYDRIIAVLIVPVTMAAFEGEPGYLIFGLIWFTPLVYMPAMAFDEFEENPLFGTWTKKGWGTLLLSFFLLFNVMDSSMLSVATDGNVQDGGELDDDYGQDLVTSCEASADCTIGESEEEGEVLVIWKASTMEKNIAYLGIAMFLLSLIAIITRCYGLVNIEALTPTVAGVILVGSFWVDAYLWTIVTDVGLSLDDMYVVPVSGVMLMTIHGLFTMSSEYSAEDE